MKRPLISLFRYMLPYKSKLFLAGLSSVLNKLCDIVPEMLIGLSIDVVIRKHHSFVAQVTGVIDPFTQLYCVGVLTAVLWILESVFEYCYLVLWRSLAQDVQHTLRLETYAHLQTLDMAYFEDKTTGGLLTIVADDINQLERFLAEGPNTVIQLFVNVVVMGSLFLYISPTIALLTLLPVPFVIFIAYYFQNRLAILYGIVRDRVAQLSSHLASRLIGMTTIKSYTAEDYEHACLLTESLAYKHDHEIASRVNAAYIPIVRMGVLCGFVMSLLGGGYLALQGSLTISFYSVLVFLTQRFLWPFTTLTTITDMYELAMASMRRVNAVLHQRRHIVDGTHELVQSQIKGALRFDQVLFSYARDFKIFKNLSFEIPAHSAVAFVGATGSGKSTIIKLLLRLYDPVHGKIMLDDIDVKTLTLKSLRQAIALVSQEVYLIDGSVFENISYGMPDASLQSVEHAAKMAEAHDFIMQLPQGYQTMLGENGKNLSGGQRQRLAIARAILKNPPIFIFDEATSALDNETEASVQRSIATLAHDHTMIIIAHRLSTVRHADIIFVMDKGVVVEQGTHQELVAKGGTYASLWKIQTGE